MHAYMHAVSDRYESFIEAAEDSSLLHATLLNVLEAVCSVGPHTATAAARAAARAAVAFVSLGCFESLL